eukprot:SAG31_NODE_9711_length_1238_cov_1.449517_2_plen_61_part_00
MPEGPYSFAEELLPPFAHNPTVRKAEDGTYVIFFIGDNRPPPLFSLPLFNPFASFPARYL